MANPPKKGGRKRKLHRGKASASVLRIVAHEQSKADKKPIRRRPVKKARPERPEPPGLVSLWNEVEKSGLNKIRSDLPDRPQWTPSQKLRILRQYRIMLDRGELPEIPKSWGHEERFVYRGLKSEKGPDPGPYDSKALMRHFDKRIAELERQIKK